MRNPLILVILFGLWGGSALAESKPKPVAFSTAAFACPAEWDGTSLAVDAGIERSVTLRLMLSPAGVAALRSSRKAEFPLTSQQSTTKPNGTAQLCIQGQPCRPAQARLEIEGGAIVNGSPLKGRVFWYEAALGRDVSLPVDAVIQPRPDNCK